MSFILSLDFCHSDTIKKISGILPCRCRCIKWRQVCVWKSVVLQGTVSRGRHTLSCTLCIITKSSNNCQLGFDTSKHTQQPEYCVFIVIINTHDAAVLSLVPAARTEKHQEINHIKRLSMINHVSDFHEQPGLLLPHQCMWSVKSAQLSSVWTCFTVIPWTLRAVSARCHQRSMWAHSTHSIQMWGSAQDSVVQVRCSVLKVTFLSHFSWSSHQFMKSGMVYFSMKSLRG